MGTAKPVFSSGFSAIKVWLISLSLIVAPVAAQSEIRNQDGRWKMEDGRWGNGETKRANEGDDEGWLCRINFQNKKSAMLSAFKNSATRHA